MIRILIEHVRRLFYLPFFERADDGLTPWQIVTWWEGRRIFYNLLVGCAGIVSVASCLLSALLGEEFLGAPIGIPDPPIFALLAIIAYGIAANICFTCGWIVENCVRMIWGAQGIHFGKISFALGVVFSVLLTLVPGVFFFSLVALRILFKLATQ